MVTAGLKWAPEISPSEEIITMMSGHVNDAGLMKLDNSMVTRLLTELRQASVTTADKLKNGAWQTLDSEMLSDLLKSKA